MSRWAISGPAQVQQNSLQKAPLDLLDHLVSAGEQRRWDFDADRPRGLQIDHQLVLGWRLHRKVGRLLTLKNAIHIASCAPELVNRIRPIGEQAADGTAQLLCPRQLFSAWVAASGNAAGPNAERGSESPVTSIGQ